MKREIIITRILEFGGSNTYLKTLIRYFGHKNILLVLSHPEDLEYVQKIDPDQSITVHYIPRLKESAKFSLSVVNNIREIYHVLRSLLTIFILYAKNGFSGITISAIEPEKYLYLFWLPLARVFYVLHTEPGKPNNRMTRLICATMLGGKKKIVTVSNSNRSSVLDKWGISKSKAKFVQVIYNCILQPGTDDIRKGKESNLILTMGHVEEYKNPQVWLEVAVKVTALNKNVVFNWLGKGYFLESFRQKTASTQQINFLGLVDNAHLFLKDAVIYYQPSISETHGIAVVEAMSHHLPCVVSSAGGLPESVEHNKSGIVTDPKDVDAQVKGILRLLDDPELRKEFGTNGYYRFEKMFSYNRFKLEMDKIYA